MPEWIDTPPEVLTILGIVAVAMSSLFFIIDSRIGKALQELKPNHGSSLRDAVDRIEHKIDRHYEWHMENK